MPVATAVIKSPEAFVGLMRDPSPGNFAEAYVDSAIDLEGDLFATMDVANAVEEVRLSPTQKVRLFLSMWRPWSDDKGPSASLAPSTAGSTYRKYASPAAIGRRLASGPFSSLVAAVSARARQL